MCGIAGFWQYSGQIDEVAEKTVLDMAGALSHRGPDSKGAWVDPQIGIALGHRRLAVVDLSPDGSQPMHSADGRYVLSFNGEIYNFQELYQYLKTHHRFRGHSDTEVMLAAFEQWGVKSAIKQFVGMFAFALWDRKEHLLSLGRDRFGEKPLYYGWIGNTFLFGSELKALKAYPNWQADIDRDAIALFLRHNYIPAPHSIYRGIYKLPPGTLLTLSAATPTARPKPHAYWSMQSTLEAGQVNCFKGSEIEATTALERLLQNSVRQQMLADVPLGAFLSGGIDSSTVVALMQSQCSRPVKTFTIGFYEDAYNEAQYAKAIAQHLGTDHTELYVTSEEALSVIPKLPILYDEPFSDSSQIPTFLVSQLARQHVTVSLSGDGGDELFGGYTRYLWAEQIWQRIGWLPKPSRRVIAKLIKSWSPNRWNQLFKLLTPVTPNAFQQSLPGDKIHKLASVLEVDNPQKLYAQLVSHWNPGSAIVTGSSEPSTILNTPNLWPTQISFIEWMMYLDTVTYLPGDILTKLDRAAMAVSLETRIPFLDHKVVEFAAALPLGLKIRQTQGKWLLRQVLYKYVPRELIERPKMGFGVPLDRWLRTDLRDWTENLLSEHRLRQEGFFNPQQIRQRWQEHISGRRNWQYHIWDILMFQAWLEKQ